MEIVLAIYLVIAGALGAAYKDGVVKDDTTVKTYQFEIKAAESAGDTVKADYLKDRLERLEK